MKIFVFLLSLITLNAYACEYLGRDGLLITKNEISTHDLALTLKSCSEQEVEIIRSTLSNLEGNIGAYQLVNILNLPEFKLNQERLIIKNLNKLAKQQLALKENIHVSAIKDGPSMVDFNSTDTLSIFCSSCLFGSHQNLSLNIRSLLGKTSKKDIKVDFITYFKAYRLLSNTQAFSTIDKSNLEVIQTKEIPHTELLTDTEQLRFFQTNKPMRAGDIIKMSDLSATKIIRAGVKSEIIIENHFIKIKTHGIPRSAGTIGEMIEVYHPEKNKKYYGKVIDINKVHVQL